MISIDLQVFFETTQSVVSFVVFFIISTQIDWRYLGDRAKKDNIDLFAVTVQTISLARLFYFMIIQEAVSKMLITLFSMLWDVMEFLFIMVLYIFFSTQVLQTFYQDQNVGAYG